MALSAAAKKAVVDIRKRHKGKGTLRHPAKDAASGKKSAVAASRAAEGEVAGK
jgi:hypothetical protein